MFLDDFGAYFSLLEMWNGKLGLCWSNSEIYLHIFKQRISREIWWSWNSGFNSSWNSSSVTYLAYFILISTVILCLDFLGTSLFMPYLIINSILFSSSKCLFLSTNHSVTLLTYKSWQIRVEEQISPDGVVRKRWGSCWVLLEENAVSVWSLIL